MEKCPYVKACGGCRTEYITKEYEESLKAKEREVKKLLGPYGRVLPILGAAEPYHYRNKVHAVVAQNRRGELQLGTYEEGTHKVVHVESCLLDDERADAIIRCIGRLMLSFHYQAYQEDTGRGFLRHILIRTGRASGQIMVTLVIADPRFPSKQNFIRALLKEHPEITTVVANVNAKRTSMILGDREEVLYGPGYIEDTLNGKTFRISSKSFYQINHEQCEKLYRIAMEAADLSGHEDILDAYSGIGTIGICAADRAASVTGVELNPEAVRDAQANVKRNGLSDRCHYLAGDAGDFMVEEATRGRHYDVVFMDPPRAGSDEKFLKSLIKASPKKVVYISCNPVTLARDLKFLTQHGYRAGMIRPVDMFPFTEHVETCALLTKKSEEHTKYTDIKGE